MNNDIKTKLKTLRQIIPNDEKKNAFRTALISRVETYYTTKIPSSSPFSIIPTFKLAPLIASIVLIALMSTGSGVVFASQNSLPGEILYPIKLSLEKVRVSFARGKEKKAKLHIVFANKRLKEVSVLIENKNTKQIHIQTAIEHYTQAIKQSNKLLDKNGKSVAHIAVLVDKATKQNLKIINKISETLEKNKEKQNDILQDLLEKAQDDTEHKNDRASFLIITSATSTKHGGEIKNTPREKSREKIKDVQKRIEKIKNKIEKERMAQKKKEEAELSKKVDAMLKEADDTLKEANKKSDNEKYEISLTKSIEARELAKEARKLQKELRKKEREAEKELRKKDKDNNRDRDEKDDND